MWPSSSQRSQNISYLVPREPSIRCWDDRVKLEAPWTKNLIDLGLGKMESPALDNGHVKVFLRVKPSDTNLHPYKVLNEKTLQTEAPKESVSYKNITNGVGTLAHNFTFTSILGQEASQKEVFDLCVSEHLKSFLLGKNFLLLAYGTTNAGKTFTMQGSIEHPGVIPRALDLVFNSLEGKVEGNHLYQPYRASELCLLNEEQAKKEAIHKSVILNLDLTKYQKHPESSCMTVRSDPSVCSLADKYENTTFREMRTRLTEEETFTTGDERYMVWVSMVEIYNEHVFDLLEYASEKGVRPKLVYGEDEAGGTYIKNLHHINVASGDEAFQVLQFGRANLHLAPTKLNQRSSRSHCICMITLARFIDFENGPHAIMSKFSFCDLAGSERVKKTLNVGDRLAESKSINTSLLILGHCLKMIKENQNNRLQRIVPYRESKLTKLFRSAVTGKEPFSMIVNLTTDPNLFDETMNVLKFSAIAQQIVPQNVFVRPRRVLKPNKSKFSRLALKSRESSRPIDWEQTTVVDESVSNITQSSNNAAYEQLLALTDRLKAELAEEKAKSQRIESETRQELYKHYTKLMDGVNEKSKNRLEQETSRLEKKFSRKEERILAYYESKLKRKRMEEEDEEAEDVEELKKELEMVKSENASLREHVHRLTEEINAMQVQNSKSSFELCETRRALEVLRRKTEAFEVGGEAELTKELQRQLKEANDKVAELKGLLDEAVAEHGDDNEQLESVVKENEELEAQLALKCDELSDLKDQLTSLEELTKQQAEGLEEGEVLTQTVQELKAGLEQVTKDKNTLDETVALLREQNSCLKQELEAALLATSSTREQVTNQKKEHETSLEAQKAKYSTIINQLREEKDKLTEEIKELKKTEITSDALKEDILKENEKMRKEEQAVIKSLKKENEQLLKECAELKNLEETSVRNLKERNHELISEMDQLRHEKEKSLKMAMERQEELAKEKSDEQSLRKEAEKLAEDAQERYKELEGEVVVLKKSCKELSLAQGKAAQEVQAAREKHEQEIAALQAEIKLLQGSSKTEVATVAEVETLKTALEELKKESESQKFVILNYELHDKLHQTEMDNLNMRIDADQYQLTVMKRMKDEAERKALEMPKLLDQIERLKNEIDNKTKENEKIIEHRQVVFSNCEKEVKRYKEENERLKKDLQFTNDVVVQNITPHKADRVQITKLKEELKHKTEEIHKLKKSMTVDEKPAGKLKKTKIEVEVDMSSSKENSPFVEVKKKSSVVSTPERLTREISKLSLQNSRCKKGDETIHPSAIRSSKKGQKSTRKKPDRVTEAPLVENEENKPKGKCSKKLFVENDFDNIEDLDSSFVEPTIPRLRPRKNC